MSEQSPIKRSALPAIPGGLDPRIRDFLTAVKHWVEIREGLSAGLWDGFVTKHDIKKLLQEDPKFNSSANTTGEGLYGAKNIMGYFDGSDWLIYFEVADSGGVFYAGDGSDEYFKYDPTNGVQIKSGKASPVALKKVMAYDSNGLALVDDSGKGMLVNDGGAVTNAYQPGFLVGLSASQSFVHDSETTVHFNDEKKDKADEFNTTTYTQTASVGGLYNYSILLKVTNADASATGYELKLVTSNRTYSKEIPVILNSDGDINIDLAIDADMDKDDTAYVTITQNGGADQASVSTDSYFSGHLLG